MALVHQEAFPGDRHGCLYLTVGNMKVVSGGHARALGHPPSTTNTRRPSAWRHTSTAGNMLGLVPVIASASRRTPQV